MNRFDDELRLAMRREEPSPDFTARVMARVQSLDQSQAARNQQEKKRENNWRERLAGFFRPPALKWAMTAATAIALIAVSFGVARHRQSRIESQRQAEIAARAEGERAKEQVMLAMRIASAKLNVAQKKVKEAAERDHEKPLTQHQPN